MGYFLRRIVGSAILLAAVDAHAAECFKDEFKAILEECGQLRTQAQVVRKDIDDFKDDIENTQTAIHELTEAVKNLEEATQHWNNIVSGRSSWWW